MNKQEAVRLFAERSFNNIPLSLVEKAYENSLFEYIVLPEEPSYLDYGLDNKYEPDFYEDAPEVPTEPHPSDYEDKEDFEVALDDYYDALEEYQLALDEYNMEYSEFQAQHDQWEEYQDALEKWQNQTEDNYPMWGTLFECEDRWLGENILEKLQGVYDCGFTVLDGFDELNVCLGVAGAGYSFYDAHWQPLYDLLGLHWHDEEEKLTQVV